MEMKFSINEIELFLAEIPKANLQPDTRYVAVRDIKKNKFLGFYPVYYPESYIGKLELDGKEGFYIGQTDSKGKLNF